MRILVVGSGGREHALAWKLAQSPECSQLYAAPGNPGIAEEAECIALDAGDHGAVINFCEEHAVGLVVIGPEAPLVDGLADSLRAANIPTFAPTQRAWRAVNGAPKGWNPEPSRLTLKEQSPPGPTASSCWPRTTTAQAGATWGRRS